MSEGVARPVPTDAFGGARLGYVQGLRGLSILAVVLYHAGGVLPRGYAGVDTFFVLSGFVITRMVWQRRELTGRVSASWFFARRIRRLLPAATVALLVTAAASALVLSPFGTMQLTAQLGRWTSVFLANHGAYAVAPDYFGTRADEVPLVHMWSLAVEEQFYIGFFVVLAFGVGRRRGRLLGWVSAALAVASLALFLRTAGGAPLPGYPAADRAAFYLAPLRGWEFLAGSLVFLLFRARRPAQTWSVVGQLAGLAAWCWFVLTPDPGPPMGPWLMVPVAATALVRGDRPAARWARRARPRRSRTSGSAPARGPVVQLVPVALAAARAQHGLVRPVCLDPLGRRHGRPRRGLGVIPVG